MPSAPAVSQNTNTHTAPMHTRITQKVVLVLTVTFDLGGSRELPLLAGSRFPMTSAT